MPQQMAVARRRAPIDKGVVREHVEQDVEADQAILGAKEPQLSTGAQCGAGFARVRIAQKRRPLVQPLAVESLAQKDVIIRH